MPHQAHTHKTHTHTLDFLLYFPFKLFSLSFLIKKFCSSFIIIIIRHRHREQKKLQCHIAHNVFNETQSSSSCVYITILSMKWKGIGNSFRSSTGSSLNAMASSSLIGSCSAREQAFIGFLHGYIRCELSLSANLIHIYFCSTLASLLDFGECEATVNNDRV
jgi:hypothetical protein